MGLRDSITPQRRQLYFRLVTLASVAFVLVAGFALAKWGGSEAKKNIAANITTTTKPANVVDGPFDPSSPENTNLPIITAPPTTNTTESPDTTTPEEAAPSDLADYEGSIMVVPQMQKVCNQSNSGLNKETYQYAADAGVALLKARTTGENISAYLDYINGSAPMVTVESVNILHACSRLSVDNSKLIEIHTWWSAQRLHGAGEITQAETVVYMNFETRLLIPENKLSSSLADQAVTTYFDDPRA